MIRFLIKFWPILVPLAALVVWWLIWGRKIKDDENLMPKWQKRLWLWVLLGTIGTMIASLLIFGFANESNTGKRIIQPKFENGKIVPSREIPRE
jgi:O-antigen ligase